MQPELASCLHNLIPLFCGFGWGAIAGSVFIRLFSHNKPLNVFFEIVGLTLLLVAWIVR